MDQLFLLGGMSRSGANMVGNILDSHPDIACGPATGILDEIAYLCLSMISSRSANRLSAYVSEEQVRDAMASTIRAIYGSYAKKTGKKIVVDRSPNNIWSFPLLAEILPEAKLIHLIRDGRDVACSQRDVGERLKTAGQSIESIADATFRSVYHCAAVWAETVRFGWEHCGPESSLAQTGRSFTTFYENIVMSPESQIRNLCEFIGVPFDAAMLYPERAKHDVEVDNTWTTQESLESPISMLSAGRWIDHLSITDRILFYARGHSGLQVTGYDESVNWIFRGMNMPVAQAVEAVEKARQDLVGIAEKAVTQQVAAPSGTPARLGIEKIIAESGVDRAAPGMPLPEIDGLLRNAVESGRTFMGS